MARSGRPFSEMLIGLSLDGSQFQDTMANINRTIKTSESVMKANLKVLGNAEKSYDDLSKNMENLTDVYTAQEKKLDKLQQAHQEAIDTYGASSKEAQKYAGQINNTVGAMATLDRQMNATRKEMIYVEEGVNDLTKEFKDHDKQMKTMVDSYKKAGNETAAYEEKQKGLTRQVDVTERAIEAQRKVIERMTTEFGENSEEARKAADSLQNLENRSRLLGSELSTTNTRLAELGQGSDSLISEQQNLVRQLDRTRSAIADQEQAVNNLRDAFGEGSREVQLAETRLADLRQEAGRTEQSIETLDDRFRGLGADRSEVDVSGLTEVEGRMDGLITKADVMKGALVGALAATGAGILSELDQAIGKIGTLQAGLATYRQTLQSGTGDSDFAKQASIYNFKDDPQGNKLETISGITGFDGPEVGKAMSVLMKTYGYTFEQAQEQLVKASRGGLKEIDELVEYLGNRDTSKLSDEAKRDLADYMITGANKAVATGGAMNTDYALDFQNEAFVRAQDEGKAQTEALKEAGGQAALDARKQFLATQDFAQYMKDMDAAIKGKQGPDEAKQRQAWITANGTQGELLNMDAIQAIVDGNTTPQYAQEAYKDGQGNTQTRQVAINGDIAPLDQMLIDANNEFGTTLGNVKDTMLLMGLTVLPDLNEALKKINKTIFDNKDRIEKGIKDFFASFKEGFISVKDAFKPITDFVYDKIYKPFAGLVGMDTSSFEGVSSWIGKVVGALSALALINLPLKGFGLIAKLFGATGPLATFMAKGVIGKATALAGGTARGVNRGLGGAVNAARPTTRAYRRDMRESVRQQQLFNSTGDNGSGSRAQQARMNAQASLARNPIANQRFPGVAGQARAGIVSRTKIAARRGWEATKADGRRAYNVLSGGPNNRNSGISASAGIATPEREERVRAAGERHRARVSSVAGKAGGIAKGVGKGALGAVKGVGKLAGGAMGMLGGPIGIILMALPIIIPLIKKLYNEFEPFKKLVDGTWAMMKNFWAWLQPILVIMWEGLKSGLASAWAAIQPILSALWGKVQEFWTWLKPILGNMWTGLKDGLSSAWTTVKPILEGLWTTVKTVFGWIMAYFNLYWTTVKTIFGFVKGLFTDFGGTVGALWTTIKTKFGEGIAFVKTKVSEWAISFGTKVSELRTSIAGKISGLWTSVKTGFSNGIAYVKEKVSGWATSFGTKVSEIRTSITGKISGLWTSLKTNFVNGINYIKEKVSGWATSFKTKVSEIRTAITERISGLWTSVKTNFTNGINFVKDKIVGFKNSVVDRFRSMRDDAGNMVNSLVDKVKAMPQKMANAIAAGKSALTKGAKTMINGLISGVEGGVNRVVGGANKVLGWFGVKSKISELDLPRYAKGTPKGGHPGGLAMVNDAKSGKYRELVRTPDGEMFIPKGRNVMLNLPKGSEVLDGKKTAKYAGVGHVPHYKNGVGDILSNLWEGTKKKASKGFDKVKDLSKNALDWVSSKVDVQGMLTKAIGKISSISGSFNNKMLKGVVAKTVSSATGFLFNKGKEAKAADGAGGESGSKYSGKWGAISNKWGVYDYLYNAVMKVVKQFPQAVITSGQRHGSRTTSGSLSDHASHAGLDISGYGRQGSPSYMAMANRIFKDSSVKYVIANNKWKKKTGGGYSNFAPGGHNNHVHVSGYQPGTAESRAKKYARGGIVDKATLGIFGEAGSEALIPLSKGRRTRGLSVLNQAANVMGQEVVSKKDSTQQQVVEELVKQNSMMAQQLNLLTQLVLKDNSLYLDGKEVYNTVESHKNKATIKTNIARGTL